MHTLNLENNLNFELIISERHKIFVDITAGEKNNFTGSQFNTAFFQIQGKNETKRGRVGPKWCKPTTVSPEIKWHHIVKKIWNIRQCAIGRFWNMEGANPDGDRLGAIVPVQVRSIRELGRQSFHFDNAGACEEEGAKVFLLNHPFFAAFKQTQSV